MSKYDKSLNTSLKMENFGEYIRRLRQATGYTLTQLAAKLNMDSANLSKVETGKRYFDEKKLGSLAEIFDLEINSLKNEFFSDKIAKNLYENNVSEETLKLAEKKVEYYRQKNSNQTKLNL